MREIRSNLCLVVDSRSNMTPSQPRGDQVESATMRYDDFDTSPRRPFSSDPDEEHDFSEREAFVCNLVQSYAT